MRQPSFTIKTMYSIAERTSLSKKIAQVDAIDTYRMLLRSHGSKRAGRIMLDRQQLAESLVYELLGKITAEEIHAQSTSASAVTTPRQVIANAVSAVKKKHQNMRNTLASVGKTLKIGLSRLLTSYIPTVSTAIRDFAKSIAAWVKRQTIRLWRNISRRWSAWKSALMSSNNSTGQGNSSENTRL